MVVMNLGILIEDTYVIFNIDLYTDDMPHIFNRNICENCMVLVSAVIFIAYTARVLASRNESVFSEPAVPKVHVISALDAFCHAHCLTIREKEVLSELLAGRSALEIAEKLYISGGTVKTHIHNLYQKVEVTRKSELIRKYSVFEAQSS
jgi:DNA-binding CsgD family transcriptional regulator